MNMLEKLITEMVSTTIVCPLCGEVHKFYHDMLKNEFSVNIISDMFASMIIRIIDEKTNPDKA